MLKLIFKTIENSPILIALCTLIICIVIYYVIIGVFSALSYYEDLNNPENKE